MDTRRRMILHLVASGRVTPAEAECLLAAPRWEGNGLLVLAAGLMAAAVALFSPQVLPANLFHAIQGWLPVDRIVSPLTRLLGGAL